MLIRFSKCSIFVPMYKMPSKAKNYLLSFYFKWLPGWSSWMLCPGNTMDFALLLPWSSVMELVRKIVKWETVSEWNIFHLIRRNHVIQFCLFLICVHCFSIINSRLFFSPCRYYPYHYAPYLSDIRNISELEIKFELGKPFMPFEQLLAVLPAASKDLLPKCYQVGFRIKSHFSIIYWFCLFYFEVTFFLYILRVLLGIFYFWI